MKKLTRHKLAFVISLIVAILLLGSTGYLIFNIALLKNIENLLRLGVVIALVIITFIFIILLIRFLRKYKKVKIVITIILALIFIGAEGFVSYNIAKVYGTIKKVSDTSGYTTYSASLIALKENDAESLSDIDDDKIGILEDKTSIEGYIIPNEVFDKKDLSNETVSYDSYIAAIDALKAKEVNYIFLPTNYPIMFGSMEGYEDIEDITKIIYTQTKKVKSKEKAKTTKPVTEPFTVLLMGVDSTEEGIGNSSFNGDSLMVITFNPKTLSTTMLSIPRDSYVPIACFPNQRKNKITHAAWKGEECMQKTIENFLDIDIDYYAKINFKGAVQLVDTLGGVEIDVPYNLCEQNSNREWGDNTVYIEQGLQTLNGEQALAYSRNRHANPDMCSAKWTNYISNDFIRGYHQQEVVMAILNKFKSIKSLDTVHKLLDTISNNMNTNMSTEQILSLYNVFKDISERNKKNEMADLLGLQKLRLNGHDARIYDYGGTNLSLYNYVLYDSSVKAVSDAMKENLGLKKKTLPKSFKFNINNPYEETIIGGEETKGDSVVLLPSFIGQSLSYVNSFCGANGIKVNVNGSGTGTVISQNVPSGANVEDVKSLTVTLSSGQVSTPQTTEKDTSNQVVTVGDDSKDDDKDKDKGSESIKHICEIVDGVYYDKNGEKTTEADYNAQCNPPASGTPSGDELAPAA